MPSRAATLLFVGCATLAVGGVCGGSAPEASPAPCALPQLPVPAAPSMLASPQPAVSLAPAAPAARDDLAERAVRTALMPDIAAATILLTATALRPRVTDLDCGDLPLPKTTIPLPTAPLPLARLVLPTAPVERPPVGLGTAAAVEVGAFPLTVRLRVNAAPPAADVPAMARQLPDRAAVEDPTADLSATDVLSTPLPLPSFARPYLKAVIPDPFEFAEHLKGKLGTETECGAAPVVVPPRPR